MLHRAVNRRRGPRRSGLSAVALSIIAAFTLALPSVTGASASEDKVKAAFLLNFTRFVDWPEGTFGTGDDPFVICVLNDKGFASTASDVIGDRKVNERGVVVRDRSSVSSGKGCHILYVPASQSAMQDSVIAELGRDSVFTVSESAGFAQKGGVANFTRSGSKLRLEINRKAASKAKLKISARLLRISDVVS